MVTIAKCSELSIFICFVNLAYLNQKYRNKKSPTSKGRAFLIFDQFTN